MPAVIMAPAGSVVVQSESWSVYTKESDYSINVKTGFIGGIPYQGEYTVTPSMVAQVLPTTGKTLGDDITIAPIPNNYGLITWDGSTLTVS